MLWQIAFIAVKIKNKSSQVFGLLCSPILLIMLGEFLVQYLQIFANFFDNCDNFFAFLSHLKVNFLAKFLQLFFRALIISLKHRLAFSVMCYSPPVLVCFWRNKCAHNSKRLSTVLSERGVWSLVTNRKEKRYTYGLTAESGAAADITDSKLQCECICMVNYSALSETSAQSLQDG